MALQIKVCLNMIVRDEERNMEPCLDNVKHLIDAAVISDTGSIDKTKNVTAEWFESKKIPYLIVDHKWTDDFGINRTLALRTAEEYLREKCDNCVWYIMFMDADNRVYGDDPLGKSLLIENPNSTEKSEQEVRETIKNNSTTLKHTEFRKFTPDINYEGIDINARRGKKFAYKILWMIKYDKEKKWIWKNRRHEYLCVDGDWKAKICLIPSGYLDSRGDGCRSQNPYVYVEDACAFLKDIKDKYEDGRSWFYLWQSLDGAGLSNIAAKVCKMSIQINKSPKELYYSHVWLAKYWFNLAVPSDVKERKMVPLLSRAYELQPLMIEAQFYLIKIWQTRAKSKIAWAFCKQFIDYKMPADALFADPEIWEFKFLFECSLVAYYSGDMDNFVLLSTKVINNKKTDQSYKESAIRNLTLYAKPKIATQDNVG